MNNIGDLAHEAGMTCPDCDTRTIVSTWFDGDAWFRIFTCAECDGADPETPFDQTPFIW